MLNIALDKAAPARAAARRGRGKVAAGPKTAVRGLAAKRVSSISHPRQPGSGNCLWAAISPSQA